MTMIIKAALKDTTRYIKDALVKLELIDFGFLNEICAIGFNQNSTNTNTIIVVGTSGLMRRSTDGGKNWATIDCLFGSTQVRGIANNGNQWCVVGSSGKISYSNDNGATWTGVTARGFQINDIVWNSILSLWVIVGAGGNLETSPDRIAWTARASGMGTTIMWDIARDTNGYMIATARGVAKYCTSIDGINWTTYTPAETYQGGVINVNGVWYAPTSNGIYKTTDRVNWSLTSIAWVNSPRDIDYSYALGCFAIATENFGLYLSFDDCKSFHQATLPFASTNRINRAKFEERTGRMLFYISNNGNQNMFKSSLAIEG